MKRLAQLQCGNVHIEILITPRTHGFIHTHADESLLIPTREECEHLLTRLPTPAPHVVILYHGIRIGNLVPEHEGFDEPALLPGYQQAFTTPSGLRIPTRLGTAHVRISLLTPRTA